MASVPTPDPFSLPANERAAAGRPALQSLLTAWRKQNPDVVLSLHEQNDNELYEALINARDAIGASQLVAG